MMRDMRGGGYQWVEVLTGPGRQRAWDEATKARVVAESDTPGAVVSAVTRRWQMAPQQLFTWRREARAASLEARRGERQRLCRSWLSRPRLRRPRLKWWSR